MTLTPDRDPGIREEEAILLDDLPSDPSAAFTLARVLGVVRVKDGDGTFNARDAFYLRGKPLAAVDPTLDQALVFDGTAWKPVSLTATVFGSQYQAGSNLAIFTTSAGTFQQRWRFSTTSLPLGSYLVLAFAEVGTDGTSAGASVAARIQINDTTTLASCLVKPGVALSRVLMGGAFHLASISGVQNFDFDLRKESGNGSVSMENARIVLFRVA